MSDSDAVGNSGEFKQGWPIISSAAVGIGLGLSPLPFYTIGVFIGPMSQELGWAPSQILLALLIYSGVVVLIAPFIGMFADKFGARRVALTSIVLFGLSMMLQSLHTGSVGLYLFYWSVLAVFGAGTLPITFTKAINNWFDVHRGKALGIVLVSTGVFGALAKFFAAEITILYGWRAAYVALGFLPIVIAFPMALVAFRDTDDEIPKESVYVKFKMPILTISAMGLAGFIYYIVQFILPAVQSKGWELQYILGSIYLVLICIPLMTIIIGNIKTTPPKPKTVGVNNEKRIVTGVTLKQAFFEWRFWLFGFVFICVSFAITGVIPNFEQILIAKNFTRAEAVGLATLTGIAVLSGRIIGGFMIDKFWAPGVAFAFLSLPAFAFYIFSGQTVSSEMATIAIMLIGFGAGVEYDFMAYLVSKYFGMREYSAIYGAMYAFFAIGGGYAPAFMSGHAEANGGWEGIMLVAAGLMIVGSLPLLVLGKYRDFSDQEDSE